MKLLQFATEAIFPLHSDPIQNRQLDNIGSQPGEYMNERVIIIVVVYKVEQFKVG